MSFGDAVDDEEGGDDEDGQPADPSQDVQSRDALLGRGGGTAGARRSADDRQRLLRFVGWRLLLGDGGADGRDGLKLGDHRVIPGHQLLTVG